LSQFSLIRPENLEGELDKKKKKKSGSPFSQKPEREKRLYCVLRERCYRLAKISDRNTEKEKKHKSSSPGLKKNSHKIKKERELHQEDARKAQRRERWGKEKKASARRKKKSKNYKFGS